MKNQDLVILKNQDLVFFNGKLTATNQKEEQTVRNFFTIELGQDGKLKFLRAILVKLVNVKKVRTEKSRTQSSQVIQNNS